MSREHFSIRNFNDSSFNYKYFVRINNKISKFINFHPNIYTYESLKIIAIANYTHMLDIFASYKLNRWKSVDSPECNVILMRFFFIRYVKTSFVNFGPRPLFHQWPPGGALAVNSVNKSLFHGQFLGTRPKSNAILVFKAISNFVNF